MKIFINFMLLISLLLSFNSIAEENFFSEQEYETPKEVEKARSEYLKNNQNATYCDQVKKSFSHTRDEIAEYAQMFNKKATECVQSLKSEQSFQCLKAELDFYKNVRSCKRVYETSLSGSSPSSRKALAESFFSCEDEARGVRNTILGKEECKGYEPLRDTRNHPNPLRFTNIITNILAHNEAPMVSEVKLSTKLDDKNEIKKKFKSCFRQAWFETKKHSFINSDRSEKNDLCYDYKEVATCLSTSTTGRFRCVYGRRSGVQVSDQMTFLSEKMAKVQSEAKELFGKWVTHSDLEAWKPNYFKLYDNLGNEIQGGGKIDYTLDVNGKFVTSKTEFQVWQEHNLTYIPELKDGYKLEWRDKDRGQIKWAKLGENVQSQLRKVYEDSSRLEKKWRYHYSANTDTLTLSASIGGENVLTVQLKKKENTGSQVVYDSEVPTPAVSDENGGVEEIQHKKVMETKKVIVNEQVAKSETNNEESHSTMPETEGAENALLDHRLKTMTAREKTVLMLESNCGEGEKNNNLNYFKIKKDQIFTNLYRDLVDLKCGATENSGCNDPQVFQKMVNFRKTYEDLAQEVKQWQRLGYVRNPEMCSQLYLK